MNRIILAAISAISLGMESASAASGPTTRQMLGSWSCVTARDGATLRIAFNADGTVDGENAGQILSGRYVLKNGSLSIISQDRFIAAHSLRIGHKTASATLINGDRVMCTHYR